MNNKNKEGCFYASKAPPAYRCWRGWKGVRQLLFLKIADHLVAVLALVGPAGDVEPVLAMGVLEDELVEVGVVLQEVEPAVGNVHVGVRTVVLPVGVGGLGQADVGRFSEGVLGGIDASYLDVEQVASVTAGDNDRLPGKGSEGFENLFAQLLEGRDVLRWNAVVNAVGLGGGTPLKLCESEVR